ncbi:MAG: hypothetical protein ACOYL5_05770 [Phototrophicaceae bacterium]
MAKRHFQLTETEIGQFRRAEQVLYAQSLLLSIQDNLAQGLETVKQRLPVSVVGGE